MNGERLRSHSITSSVRRQNRYDTRARLKWNRVFNTDSFRKNEQALCKPNSELENGMDARTVSTEVSKDRHARRPTESLAGENLRDYLTAFRQMHGSISVDTMNARDIEKTFDLVLTAVRESLISLTPKDYQHLNEAQLGQLRGLPNSKKLEMINQMMVRLCG